QLNGAEGKRIGLFSYGSGAVGEFFSGILQPNYRDYLAFDKRRDLFDNRQEVTVSEYEQIFEETLPIDGSTVELDVTKDPSPICLSGITEHERQYVNKNR